MSKEIDVCKNVEDLINDIIAKLRLDSPFKVMYDVAGDLGEGYLSKTVAVTIHYGHEEKLEFFVKYVLSTSSDALPFEKCFVNEIHFYDVIYPAYTKFAEDRNVRNGFCNVPVCYGTSKNNVIALENLKRKGYVLFDARRYVNDSHIVLVFKALARFHAISFTFKDQRRQTYEKLIKNLHNIYAYQNVGTFNEAKKLQIKEFLASLDPIEDKHLLDGCGDLANNLVKFGEDVVNIDSDYSILIQGDCWCNNVFFSYQENDRQNPSDVMLIDWQMLRPTLPVYDLSFFFYTVANEEMLDRSDYFLKIYHEELSKNIRDLGSSPEKLYPFSVLKDHWKGHSKYGFLLAFITIHLILTEKDEAMNLEELDVEVVNPFPKIRSHGEYIRRLRVLAEHFVKNDFL